MKNIWGIKLHDISWKKYDKLLKEWMQDGVARVIVTPNAEMLLDSRKNDLLKNDLNAADLAIVDSHALELALVSKGSAFKHGRKPGVDALERLFKVASGEEKLIGIVGSTGETAGRAIASISSMYPKLKCVWMDIGHIERDASLDVTIAKKIESTDCDILVVALGHGKQERFMQVYKNSIHNINLMIGVGGAIDMIGGKFKRAPKFMRGLGLEWLWRLGQEPKRVKRISNAVICFPIYIILDRIRDKTFFRATLRVLNYLRTSYGKNTHRA